MIGLAVIMVIPLAVFFGAVGHGLWQDRLSDRRRALRPSVTIRRWSPSGWFRDVEWPSGIGTAGFARTRMGARFAAWRVAR